MKHTKELPEHIGGVSDSELIDRLQALRMIDQMLRSDLISTEGWQRMREEVAPGIGTGEPAGGKIRANNIKRWREQKTERER